MTLRSSRRSSVVLMLIGSSLQMLCMASASAQPKTQPALEIDQPALEIAPVLINDVEAAKLALHPLRPFIEPSTFLIADFSVSDIDPAAMSVWLKENFSQIAQGAPVDFVSALVQGNLLQLRDSGASNLYVMVSTRIAGDRAPVVVIPCQQTDVVAKLAQAIVNTTPGELNLGVETIGRAVLVGPKRVLERIQAQQGKPPAGNPAQLDQLISQLIKPSELPHRLVLQLPKEARDELIAFWPESMPQDSPIKLSPRQVLADLSSLNVFWKLPPDPLARIEVIAVDDAGARDRLHAIVRDTIALYPEVSPHVRLSAEEGQLVLDADLAAIMKLIKQPVAMLQENVARQQSMSNAKQIMLAMHMYYQQHRHLPAPGITDKQGRPLLSWRVAILPFIEQKALYDQFKLDQPWDSEHNAKLISRTPTAFGDAGTPADPGKTRFRLPEIAGGAWEKRDKPLTFSAITDGTSVTIAFVQAPQHAAVPWTQPETFDLENGDPAAVLFGDEQQIITARFDGSVFVVAKDEMPAEKLRAWLTIAGGEVLP